jgi:hypothetical protein
MEVIIKITTKIIIEIIIMIKIKVEIIKEEMGDITKENIQIMVKGNQDIIKIDRDMRNRQF